MWEKSYDYHSATGVVMKIISESVKIEKGPGLLPW